ncbi:MAG: hypothetical protein R3267_09230 [Paenisporosarcina sp.]|nr:hypothetical protein [Paenisporosarcina sp.]
MWEMYQQNQSELQVLMNEEERLVRRMESLKQEILDYSGKRNNLERQVTKEQQDVAKLEGFSFANMVRNWRGNLDEIRDQEKAEAAAVELKWNEAVKTVKDLEQEEQNVRKELADERFRQLHLRWQTLMTEKEQWLQDNSPENHAVLENLYTRKTEIKTMLQEIEEAHSAGISAKSLLSNAIIQLASAKTYSTWDTFLGGGLIVTAMKHHAIDDSEDIIHRAQLALQRFQREVNEVEAIEENAFTVERGGFIKVADYFFDDIFSEWTIHSRIKKSQGNLEKTNHDVSKVLRALEDKKHLLESELTEIESKRKEMIEA